MTRTLLVLGGTSAIGHSYARRRAAKGLQILLVGRKAEQLAANAADLTARGARAGFAVSDLADVRDAAARWQGWTDALGGRVDELLLVYGSLTDQQAAIADPEATFDALSVNFSSAAAWLTCTGRFMAPGPETAVVVVGSVAGDRGRQSNYVYGAAKAGLATFVEGMAHRFAGTGMRILLVKPGFVDTPMTAAFEKYGPLWAQPDDIAHAMEKALRNRRTVIYAPGFWRLIMFVVRSLPRAVFHRTRL